MMFTGIIEETGIVRSIKRTAHSAKVAIHAKTVLEETKIGDSIACDGVCLTVTKLHDDAFEVDIMHETMERTTFASLRAHAKLNLERALKASDRLGGHIVSGHIDDTGTIAEKKKDDIAHWVKVRTAPALMRYIVEKGSIAIDGISLTVAKTEQNAFWVSIIPHTEDVTTLLDKRVHEKVNLECDIIGKYVEKLTQPHTGSSSLDEAFLKRHGY